MCPLRLAPGTMGIACRSLVLWILLCGSNTASSGTLQPYAPTSVLGPEQTGLVINISDPLSVVVGEYYAARRRIPPGNIIRARFLGGWPGMAPDEFDALRAHVEALLPRQVQVLALAWTQPYRVGCMSITTAFAFGYDPSFCSRHCEATRPSLYFDSDSRLPFEELGVRPAMLLAARDFDHARALIDRGARSDGTLPQGSAYLLATTDRARTVRQVRFDAARRAVHGRIPVQILHQDVLRERQDILFYLTGLPRVAALETLHFLPGAVADHLTSFGGQLLDSPQMSALAWLEAGATGSYGTVLEPCNLPGKFPDPAVLMRHYLQGESLVEAYWKSVAMPGEGVFIGEPLAAPFRAPQKRPVVR